MESSLERTAEGWVARYRVRARDPVRLTSVDVRIEGPGGDDPQLRRAVEDFPLRRGEPLRHPTWTRGKETLLHRATARGYLDATFAENGVEVDLATYEARATLRLETGPRFRFGPVRFEGSHFERDFLIRYVPFREGDPFVLEELLAVQSELAASPYFRRVEVVPRREEASELRVPILVALRDRPQNGISGGVGYATDTGPRGTFAWDRRWLGEGGDRLHGELRASFVTRTAALNYIVPVGRRSDDELAFTAAAQDDESFEDARSRSLRATGAFTHGRGGWRESVSLTLKSEWFDVGDVSSRSTLVLPEASWTRTRANQALVPTRGSRLAGRFTGTAEAIGSDVSFGQILLRARAIRSPLDGARIIARVEVGATAVDDLTDLPVSHRFFAGGDQSVRGYDFHEIGPRDSEGLVIGGRHLVAGSLEYEHTVWGPLAAAVFADAGNAFVDLDGSLDLETGVGTGARWRSPIGPVKLDVAWAVSRSGRPVRLHFSVGAGL
ncbi:MAG TPA: autotransporter assembly complex family protein [Longimicrobiales bacterium]|nr:autotransporter assembly complex family protein [Longimicrobiales bacterium]